MSQEQYTSPKSWGPHFWFMLRCIAYNYPLKPSAEDANHARTFILELQYLLPCELCKYTFKQHFTKYPIDKGLINKASLMEWIETIYQETKKIIQDNRIKILDSYEEPDEVKPIRIAYKPRIDPMEEQLNEIRKNVMKKDNNNRAIQLPPVISTSKAVPSSLSQPIQQSFIINDNKSIKSIPITQSSQKNKLSREHLNLQKMNNPSKNTFKINEILPAPIEKINVGKKIDIEDPVKKKIKNIQSANVQSQPQPQPQPLSQPQTNQLQQSLIELELQKLKQPTALKLELPIKAPPLKIDQTKIQPSKPYPPILNNLKNIINEEKQLEITPKQINTKSDAKSIISKRDKVPQLAYINKKLNLDKQLKFVPQHRFFAPKTNSKDLVLTRKCKKCEH